MFQTYARSILRNTGRISGVTILTSFATATYYRPIQDRRHEKDDDMTKTKSSTAETQIHKSPTRQSEFFCSSQKTLFTRDETPIWYDIARHVTIGMTTIVIRIFMNTYGEYNIVNDENYHNFLTLVLGGDGREEKQQGMITISNHRSLFDDPGIVSCLLPLWIGIQPKYNRWGICSQEYCFADKLPAIVKGYIGAGQVLPIIRGGGINQSFLKDFSTILGRGEWCHIFPEGGTWQDNELGGRGRDYSFSPERIDLTKSKLKWGVGKLIAHAPIRPRVIPFAHVGMETILPKNRTTGKTRLKIKLFDNEPLKVHVQFGEGVIFLDDFHYCHS